MSEDFTDGPAFGGGELLVEVALPGRRREHDSTRRNLRLTPRFSAGERAELVEAAAAVGMTVNGFAAEAALTARVAELVRRGSGPGGVGSAAAAAIRSQDGGEPVRHERQPGRGRAALDRPSTD